ncbi:DNA helicase [Mycena maculata]|uniref:DNA 3'-5' helicase n=1 Tax=Mycena maculata TaxID=230809 RepID=A0AAD7MXD4_9AGAR|nr:DNA helicase [Mycena maculata]
MSQSGAPKNNLDDVLRHRLANPAASLQPNAQPKSTKFKPATSSSISAPPPIRKQASTTLPSFSTPGFGKSKTNASRPGSGFHETISISTNSTPSPGIKRSSSDSQIEPQHPKRLKYEKENKPEAVRVDKGEAKAKAPSSRSTVETDDDNEPWLRMETSEANPFAMLDRDFPKYCRPSVEAPAAQPPTTYPDLLAKSTEQLNNILLFNHEANRLNLEAICNYHAGPTKKDDIHTLEAIKSLLNDRIAGVKRMLEYREEQARRIDSQSSITSAAPSRSSVADPADNQLHPLPVAGPSTTRSYETTSYASTSKTTVREGSTVSTRDSTFVSVRERNVQQTFAPDRGDEDEDLWADMDDVTMDHLDDDPAPVPAPVALTGPYASEIFSNLKRVFRLDSFRRNQFEAIDATMAGRDVFVLMPTGGGKSLCYQLPAVCRGGKTKGVTVVVSPLLALMHDQVNRLLEKDIDAVLLTSSTAEEESRNITARMYGNSKPTLLYITPERLKISSNLKNMLANLYRRRELARFVIDEAHCIATWGQDFREAYQDLHTLRDDFPDVPIMALTATADQKTMDDILGRLKLRNPAIFKQSFNRPNLNYRVVPKGSVDEMVSFIKGTHQDKTGVIYRTGRDNCEKLAKKLREKGLNAKHFHAKMDNVDKETALAQWQSGECHIMVATIAFGMGIDKADVRFVIHYDLPKTMSGYYQETGRAGRDDLPADCVLYYSYKDLRPILSMIRDPKDPNTTRESIERQEQAVRAVVQYCENESVCRRIQILQHFGEKFDKKDCHGLCNNCANEGLFVTQDVTKEAKSVLALVQSLERGRENVTLDHCRNIYKGANTAQVRDKGHNNHPAYGAGKDLSKELVELLFNRLLYLDVLVERSIQTNSKWHQQYLKLGPCADDFLTGNKPLQLSHRPKTPKPGKAKPIKRRVAAANAQEQERAQPLYDDDPMDEIEWSPQKPVRKPPPPLVEVISDSEDDEPAAVPRSPGPEKLYTKLVNHRRMILQRDSSLRKEDVFDDETLQLISLTAPQDFRAFQRVMKEAGLEVEERYSAHGSSFLQICQGRKADPNTWQEKFAFPGQSAAAASSGPGNAWKFKFSKK